MSHLLLAVRKDQVFVKCSVLTIIAVSDMWSFKYVLNISCLVEENHVGPSLELKEQKKV